MYLLRALKNKVKDEVSPAQQLRRLVQPAMDESQSLPTIEEESTAPAQFDRKARRATTIAKIEDIFCSLVHDLIAERRLSIPFKTRKQNLVKAHTRSLRILCFPGRIDGEARRFGASNIALTLFYTDELLSCGDTYLINNS